MPHLLKATRDAATSSAHYEVTDVTGRVVMVAPIRTITKVFDLRPEAVCRIAQEARCELHFNGRLKLGYGQIITQQVTNHSYAYILQGGVQQTPDPIDQITAEDNPFDPESPEGRAWERGDRSSIKP